MSPSLRHLTRRAALPALLTLACAPAAHATVLHTVASDLNQPKKITVTRGGDLVVALSGDGVASTSCTDGEQVACLDHSGAIDLITPSGKVRVLRSGLPSVAESHTESQATGPVQAILRDGVLRVLFQNTSISQTTGAEIYGSGGSLMDTLTAFAHSGAGIATVLSDLGPFEARENPDHGEGTNVADGDDAAVDSDPYGMVAYRGGWAVADAGGNDVLWISPAGAIKVLAVLPTIKERAAAGTFGTTQTKAIEAQAQPVPDAIAVSPDGTLYVGEFGGEPYDRHTSEIDRVVPGHRARVVARGFDAIDDMTFDSHGHLLVLELDRKGLADPGFDRNDPADGALYRVNVATGARQLLASSGLSLPTGVAAVGNEIYLSIDGLSTDGGKIVRLREL